MDPTMPGVDNEEPPIGELSMADGSPCGGSFDELPDFGDLAAEDPESTAQRERAGVGVRKQCVYRLQPHSDTPHPLTRRPRRSRLC